MEEKVNGLVSKLEALFDKVVSELETDPVKTMIKVVIILWLVKKARQMWSAR